MNAAVIVETRLISSIAQTIKDHMKYLPGWELIIFYGRPNVHLFNEFECEKNMVTVNTLWDYNHLMTDTYFWRHLTRYERVLVFQNDSGILHSGIDEFLQYDYIGGPWKFQHRGGNGGLSIRNPRAMFDLCRNNPYNKSLGYEDVYFSNHIENVAPREICEEFSVETIFKLGTLGYHAIDNWLSIKECNLIRNQYAE